MLSSRSASIDHHHVPLIVQAALVTLSWFAMTGLCAIMTVSTSLSIVRSRGKLSVAEFQRSLEWHPVYMPVMVGCLAIFFTICLVVSLKLHAIEGADGLQCDVAHHEWCVHHSVMSS